MLADNLNDIGGVLYLPDCILVNHCASTLSVSAAKFLQRAAMAVFWVPRDFGDRIKATSEPIKPLFR